MKLDGNKIIAEYEPERKIIKYECDTALSIGSHKISVAAFDNCNNNSKVVHSFSIK